MLEQIIICYIENGVQLFDATSNGEEWQKNHPDAIIKYKFKKSDDIIDTENTKKEDFQFRSQFYGFATTDYKTKLIIRDQIGTLVGFLPQNRKYKCSVIIESTGKKYKMTIAGVKQGIEKYNQKYNKDSDNP